MKKIRLTEAQLYNIIKSCINEAINEIGDTPEGQHMLGRLAARKSTNGDIFDYYNVLDYAKDKRKGVDDNLMMQDKYAKGFHKEKAEILGK